MTSSIINVDFTSLPVSTSNSFQIIVNTSDILYKDTSYQVKIETKTRVDATWVMRFVIYTYNI